MRVVFAAIALCLSLGSAHAGGDGLSPAIDQIPWARFQSRVVAGASPGWRASLAPGERRGLQATSLGVLGDVYFGSPTAAREQTPSGFRATSGVLVGPRNPLWGATASTLSGNDRRVFGASAPPAIGQADASPDTATIPYLGIGYSALPARSGWRFSADLGVVSQSPSNAVRLGRVFSSPQSLDDVVRDMRLSPLIHLGVSYSF